MVRKAIAFLCNYLDASSSRLPHVCLLRKLAGKDPCSSLNGCVMEARIEAQITRCCINSCQLV